MRNMRNKQKEMNNKKRTIDEILMTRRVIRKEITNDKTKSLLT